MKPTERFSNRAETYRRYRPGYPRAVAEFIREQGQLAPGMLVADIGAGTGLFTRVLLDAGFKVAAVEPNEAMRAAAEEDLSLITGFSSLNGTAERTGLADHSIDAVVSAQAFHWFEREAARSEFARILKPGAWIFLVWNQWHGRPSNFNNAYAEFIGRPGLEFDRVRSRSIEAEEKLGDFFALGAFDSRKFANPQIMDWECFRGRFLSISYVPPEYDPASRPLLEELKRLFDTHQHDGVVCLEQETEVYYGRIH